MSVKEVEFSELVLNESLEAATPHLSVTYMRGRFELERKTVPGSASRLAPSRRPEPVRDVIP